MRFFKVLIILVIFQNCSFDNKTGIWKNENIVSDKDEVLFKDFKTLSSSTKVFDKIIPYNKKFKFKIAKATDNFEWKDIFYDESNNLKNFKYKGLNRLIFKSKKITKHKTNDYLLFEENNLITSDQKGNIIIFSISENKIISKFNFYKKRYKNIKKTLNLIVENNIIYIADNIGFIYAFNYKINKLVWAKNNKVPFRSNLKIIKNKLIASSQNNDLYIFSKLSGDTIKLIPTEDTIVKNQFINNLSLNKNNLFFLNTYGSLYSIDKDNLKINWFINLNQSIDLNPSNLFSGHQIINKKNIIVISSNQFTYIINASSGSVIHKKNFSSQIKPLILDDYLFLITQNNLLIAMNINNGEVIYSLDINQQISEFLNIKKKSVSFKSIVAANNEVFIFLKNSYLLKYKINGILEEVIKLPSKIDSQPIFVNSSLAFLDSSNKLSIID